MAKGQKLRPLKHDKKPVLDMSIRNWLPDVQMVTCHSSGRDKLCSILRQLNKTNSDFSNAQNKNWYHGEIKIWLESRKNIPAANGDRNECTIKKKKNQNWHVGQKLYVWTISSDFLQHRKWVETENGRRPNYVDLNSNKRPYSLYFRFTFCIVAGRIEQLIVPAETWTWRNLYFLV